MERKIVDGRNGEAGARNVKVISTIESRTANTAISFCISSALRNRPHKIVSTQDYTPNNLPIRTFFHLFFLNEEHIFKKDTPLYSAAYKKPTASIMSLLFLLEGKDYKEIIPEESAEEREQRVIQKAGAIIYLNKKITVASSSSQSFTITGIVSLPASSEVRFLR